MYLSHMNQRMMEGVLQIGFIKRIVLSFVYKYELARLNEVLAKDCVKLYANKIDKKDPFSWSVQDFKKLKFATHPDKCGNADDFSIINNFQS